MRSYTPAGALRWEFPVGEGVYSSSPALAPDGTLYIGSMDGALYALADPPAAPNVIVGLTFDAGSVYGGEPASARVTLRDPAGPGGATVMISALKIAAVQVPPSVVVPAGSTFATFEVTTFRVTEPHAVEICGSYGGQSRCSVLVVEPRPTSKLRPGKAAASNGGR